MKKMTKGRITLNIVEHIILRNFWEYYITDENFTDDIVQALVVGFETEIGDVSLKEIEPYIVTRTTDLDHVFPPLIGNG